MKATTFKVKVKNSTTEKSIVVEINGHDPMLVHKEVYMGLKQDEEIESIKTGSDTCFTLKDGFKY